MSEKSASDVNFGLEVSKGFVAKLVQGVLGFAGTIVFARILGPTDFGGYYLLLSVVGIVRRPVSGINAASQKRFAESDSPRGELLGLQTVLNAGLIVIAATGAALLHGSLKSYTGLSDAATFFVVLLTALTSFSTFQSFLTSIGRIGIQTWIDTFRSVLTLGLQLALVAVGWGVGGMVGGLAVASVSVIPITHYYLRVVPALPSRETISSVWSFAKYSLPGTIIGKAYDRFDVLLLGFFATPAVVGWYEVSARLTIPAMFVADIVTSGVLARVSDQVSRGETASDDITNSLAFASFFSIPIFFGTLAISERLVVTAYGPAYRDAAALLIGLALYRVIQTQSGVLSGILQALDRPDIEVRASAGALALNVVLGAGLFVLIGPLGVVIGTVVAEILRYVVFYTSTSRAVSATLMPRLLFEQTAAGVVMFVVVEFAARLTIASWQAVGLLVGVGGLVYFVILGLVSTHFRATIRGITDQLLTEYDFY